MRWVIHSRAAFEARHALTSYHGEAEEVHSHLWEVAVQVGAESLNNEGFALDFHLVHAVLAEAAAPLENSNLGDHPDIGLPSPTAERLALFLAGKLEPRYEEFGGRLLSVSVWEGPENRVDLILDD